jgi:RHS repeat-associated protein
MLAKNIFKNMLTLSVFILIFNVQLLSQVNSPATTAGKTVSSRTKTDLGMEIKAKRTANSKTFVNAETGQATLLISPGYMHYKGKDGNYHEINHRLMHFDSTTVGVRKGMFHATFNHDLQSEWPFTMETRDGITIRWRIHALAYANKNGNDFHVIHQLQPVKPTVVKNTITYPNIFPGADLRLQYRDTEIKEELILTPAGRTALPEPEAFGLNSEDAFLMLVAEYDTDASLTPFANGQNIANTDHTTNGTVRFCNAGGKTRFLFPINIAFRQEERDDPFITTYPLEKRLFKRNGKNFFMVGLDYTQLQAIPDGALVLDPTTAVEVDTVGQDSKLGHFSSSATEYYNYGASSNVQVHSNKYSSNYWGIRGLVQFDLSRIPENADIDSAFLKMYFYSGALYRDQNCHDMHIHEISRSWVEGTGIGTQTNDGVDYHRYDGSNNWTTSGGDFVSTPEDTVVFCKDSLGWKLFNLSTSVQDMVDGTVTNYGWLMKWDSDLGSGRVDADAVFYSSEYTTDVRKRPLLEVHYQADPLVTYDYDAMGRVRKAELANGVDEINQYDTERNWLVRRDYKENSSNIVYFNSTGSTDFDAVGNLNKVISRYGTESTQTYEYEYDDLNRIKTFKIGGSTQRQYGYDANGNLTSFTGLTLSYGNDNNQLTGDGSRTFSFDDAGRVETISSTSLGYDCLSNMVSYGNDAYGYDHENLRIWKIESGDTTFYIRDGLQELAEYGSDNELLGEYYYAHGRKLVKHDPDKGLLWYYTDHLGSTRLLELGTQQSDMRRDYYPFGEAVTSSGDEESLYQFTGKEKDSNTGLFYFGARYYDPGIGRFLSVDPLAEKYWAWSPYAYGLDNPMRFIDPDGNQSRESDDEKDEFSLSNLLDGFRQQINSVFQVKYNKEYDKENMDDSRTVDDLGPSKIPTAKEIGKSAAKSYIGLSVNNKSAQNFYMDTNYTISAASSPGVTGGFIVDANGQVHPYYGVSVWSFGPSHSVTYSNSGVTEGWNWGLAFSIGTINGQLGSNISEKPKFYWEVGFTTPPSRPVSGSLTIHNVE